MVLHHRLDTFIKSEAISEVMEQEFEQLLSWFYNIEELSKTYFGQNFIISFEYLISNFFKLLNDKKCSNENIDLHCLGIKVLRKLIEVRNNKKLTPSSDWDTDDWIH